MINHKNIEKEFNLVEFPYPSGVETYVDFKIKENDETLKVYTTRPDMLFGVTFMVIAPEHPLIDQYAPSIKNMIEIESYRKECQKKTESERIQLVKDQTGVKIDGFTAINPVNNESIPVYISDYVIMSYGTGAVMVVPAHDKRNHDFATKFGLDIIPVIKQETGEKRENESFKESVMAIIYNPEIDQYLTLYWKNQNDFQFLGETKEHGEDDITAAIRGIKEETGFVNIKHIKSTNAIHHHYYAHNKNKAFEIDCTGHLFELLNPETISQTLDKEEMNAFDLVWKTKKELVNLIQEPLNKAVMEILLNDEVFIGEGIYINSDFLNGITNKQEAIDKMLDFLNKKGIEK